MTARRYTSPPESIPDHTAKYIARDTLAAVKRFYENPSNRAAFEEWRRKRKKETE